MCLFFQGVSLNFSLGKNSNIPSYLFRILQYVQNPPSFYLNVVFLQDLKEALKKGKEGAKPVDPQHESDKQANPPTHFQSQMNDQQQTPQQKHHNEVFVQVKLPIIKPLFIN